jgi:hypothetical protein
LLALLLDGNFLILCAHVFVEVMGSTHRLLDVVQVVGSMTLNAVVTLTIEVTKLVLVLFNFFVCVEELVTYYNMVVCAESRFESAEENVIFLKLVRSQLVD